jgi:hypothetical protein
LNQDPEKLVKLLILINKPMVTKKVLVPLIAITAVMATWIISRNDTPAGKQKMNFKILVDEEEGQEDSKMEAENSRKRSQYEWLLTRDPKTGQIPEGIRARELAQPLCFFSWF